VNLNDEIRAREQAGRKLLHAASLCLLDAPTRAELATALVLTGLALLQLAESDPRGEVRRMAEGFVRAEMEARKI
jgi:hypothetical protein